MAREKLKKLLANAQSKDLTNFRKGLKEVLKGKIQSALAERETKIAKTLFKDDDKK